MLHNDHVASMNGVEGGLFGCGGTVESSFQAGLGFGDGGVRVEIRALTSL